jgi:hypothetical protein
LILGVTRQFPNEPAMIHPSLWYTIRRDIQKIVIKLMDYPIRVSSDSYEPIVIYGMTYTPFKVLREQLSDILSIPDPQMITLHQGYGAWGLGKRYSDDDIVQDSVLNPKGTGLWMEIRR